MRLFTLWLILSCFSSMNLYSQAGGVSGSKVNAINALTIDANSIEFEPLLETGWANKHWNQYGQRENLFDTQDSISRFTSLSYRISYGITDLLEAGLSISGDFEMVSFGVKRQLYSSELYGLSIIGAYNHFAGNGVYNLSELRPRHSAIAFGLASTLKQSDKFSVDLDVQFEPGIKRSRILNKFTHYYLNADAGYYFGDHFQLITGLSYARVRSEAETYPQIAQLLRLIPGFTFEKGENFILVGGFPICLAGMNYVCATGFQLALTLIIH